jgi:hypothetical protein
MASEFPGGGVKRSGMVERVKAILMQPQVEWDRIDAEPMTERDILTSWVVPLAAIGPIAGLIGQQLFGWGAFGASFRPSLAFSLVMAVLGFVMSLIGVWVLAKVIDALAPTFGAVKNPIAAMKVAAFSATATWIAGVFQIVPVLAFLGLLGLYSLYLLWLGLPRLMRVPADKAVGYYVATLVVAILINIVVGTVVSQIAFRVANPMPGMITGTVDVPGMGKVDLAKMDVAAKQMEVQAARMEAAAGAVTAGAAAGSTAAGVTDPKALAAMLPTSAAGWTRSAVESSGGQAGGIGAAGAKGSYAQGSDTATLSVADMGALGGLAGMAGALNVQSNKETESGYEKVSTVAGRMTTEEWDRTAKRGKYGTIVANRFMVEAEGSASDIAALKALVGSVDLGKLAEMAK